MTMTEDVIRAACDAPTLLQRQRADYLAGFELLFRINTFRTTVDTSAFSMDAGVDHRLALSVVGDPSVALSGRVALFANYDRDQFGCHAGDRRANTYWFSRHHWNGQLGRVAVGYGQGLPHNVQRYARDQLELRASALIAEVQGAMGAAFYATRRSVWSPNLPLGGAPLLYACLGTDVGPIVLPAGDYNVQLGLDLWSPDDESNPATVSIAILVDGTPQAIATVTRETRDSRGELLPSDPKRGGDLARLDSDNKVTLSGTGAITIANANTLAQRAIGVVRVFPVED